MPVHEVYKNGVVVSRVEVVASADDVKAEAQRRIIALCGATTIEGAMLKQINAALAADAEALRLSDGINAIRAASNIIEVDPPVEVSTDPRWPA